MVEVAAVPKDEKKTPLTGAGGASHLTPEEVSQLRLMLQAKAAGRVLRSDEAGAETFGQVVKRLREQRRLTQAELAAKTGLSRVTVARIETDATSPPFLTIVRIVRELGGSLAVFDDVIVPDGETP